MRRTSNGCPVAAAKQEGNRSAGKAPIWFPGLNAMPRDIRVAASDTIPATQELRLAQGRAFPAEGNHPFHNPQQFAVLLSEGPVEPVPVLVLAIGVVVPSLSAAALITHVNHWDPLADEKNRHGVLLLTKPYRIDLRVLSLPLHAAVVTVVIVRAVVVVFAIVEIVLLVIRNEVAQGKPVVTRDKIDRRSGLASGRQIKIG